MKYNIIYIDPPWTYRDKAKAGNRGAECKYPVMSQKEIANLPINQIANDDCILFLWITMPKLDEVFAIINKWGFEYKTVAFVWVKKNKIKDTPFMGMGRWTRANAELCLLATKGKPKRISASVHQIIDTLDDYSPVIYSPIEGHSKKPDIVKDKIIELCSDLPRIEIFARQQTEGWDVLGNDIDGRDIRESLQELIS